MSHSTSTLRGAFEWKDSQGKQENWGTMMHRVSNILQKAL